MISRFIKICLCAVVFCTFSNQLFATAHGSPNSQGSLYNWDIDNDGNADALTDGLLMLRYTFNLRGDVLVAGAISPSSALTPNEIETRLDTLMAIADIDGNNQVDALTDGLLLLRFLFGLEGQNLIAGAVNNGATRHSSSDIHGYLASYMPGQAPLDSDDDGVADSIDTFPTDPNEYQDSDGDGVGDNSDEFPNDSSESQDSDGDGVGDNADAFPNDSSEFQDSDGDGVGNNADAFPNDPNETQDANQNGIGDNADAANNSSNNGPQSDYCATALYHLNIQTESSSSVDLTVENIGNDQLRIAITSSDTSAVDDLIIESSTGASVASDSSAGAGELAKTLSWSGSMPSNETFNILWSKTTIGGHWIVRNISVATDAVCGGNTGNTGSNTGSNTNDNSGSNANDSSGSAPTPDESASDVLSIFSDTYTDISGVNFDPNWGQATSVTVANGEINYQSLNYQGTTFGGPKDVSGYGYLHIDIRPQQSGSLQLYLINSAAVSGVVVETYFDLNLTANQWNSFDIPLSSYSSVVDLTKVDEIKIVGSGSMSLNNLYFGGESSYDNGDNNDDLYTGDDVIPTEEIAVANGVLVGGVNSTKPQFVVYVFDSDPVDSGLSNCYGGCASAWPPVYVTDDAASGVSGLGSITRSDGTQQVTFEGRPLYFYAGDQQAGDRSGDSVIGWHSIEYGNIGEINMLYNDSTPLEPATSFVRDDGVIVTRLADRGRDRHAKDSGFQDHYDHYLAHYWQFRTMRMQFEDYVPLGQSKIAVTWITEAQLGAKEFRVWYAGQNTTGQFWFNPQPLGQQANPNEPAVVYHGSGTWNDDFVKTSNQGGQHKYTLNITRRWQLGGQIQETLATGMNMEFEASMFLLNPPAGSRLNYYGTSFVYVIGEQGVHPFKWQSGQQDGTPIAQKGLSGGYTTLGYNYTNEPAGRFMQMATNMSPGNAEPFVRGRRVHHTSFVNGVHGERNDNPVWTQQAGKAGTHYINESCAGCHVRNGRALVADVGDSLDRWVFRVGDENGEPLDSIGSVLQPQKIGGGTSEGTVVLGPWTELPNGLRAPNYQFSNGTPPQFSARIAPSLVGIGLLEAIEESTIISWVDENDANNDGISGRPSLVEDPTSGVTRLGRFGYKAGTFSVKHQVASALNTDMGVMTSMLPNPDCGSQQTNCGSSGSEIADQHIDELVKYVSLLGVGARRDYNNQTGESVFQSIGCAGCHRPSVVTSNFHPLTELRGQTIYPYSDLLLHDMGPGLADNLAEGAASGSEWRTAPLWGLGLTKNVMLGDVKGNDEISIADAQNRSANMQRIGYLHDGRARTIDEAIRWHGGEALNAKDAYEALSSSDKNALLNFLESL